jgi:type II secretion system protein G
VKIQCNQQTYAFTLIELLIVVAIIGILAAIAVPNFLNAQVRAKIANTEADQRSLATALESYRLDNNMYPPTPNTAANLRFARLAKLTSPVSYMSSVPFDPFRSRLVHDRLDSAYPFWDPETADNAKHNGTRFSLLPQEEKRFGRWVLHGAGPDQDYEPDTGGGGSGDIRLFEPSNGLNSDGDIDRFGP